MGFGHRVYKNFDPRATLMRKVCQDVLSSVKSTKELELAKQLRTALYAMIDDRDTSEALEKSWGLSGFVKPMHALYDDVAKHVGIAG